VSQSGGTHVSAVVGSGVATTGYTTLNFGPAQLGGAGGAIASARSFHVSCSIPSRNQGSSGSCHRDGYSTIAGYSVETVNP
jgi:hypothetical protein